MPAPIAAERSSALLQGRAPLSGASEMRKDSGFTEPCIGTPGFAVLGKTVMGD